MIIGLHHPGIVVPDLDKARDFYARLLDLEVVVEESWGAPNPVYDQGTGLRNSAARGYVMRGGNFYLELWEYSEPPSEADPGSLGANDYGIRHICFEVDDVVAEWERLRELGGMHMNRPVLFEDGSGSAVYCRDPFGNLIEFTTAGEGYPSLSRLVAITDPGSGSMRDKGCQPA
jgi:catechol 2,3-dioxygenase-like lactoylglutathione lyase family enzyme